ncbi:MAG: leucine-rich repeat domain-containing protein [Bacteroidaceae bacterium]|nr:leucine-rich repeat domain-containing protein [Bacteroidaceae bacterium]
MKKSLLLLVAALTTLVASAQTKVEINGIWYNLVSKAKQAEVTFKGDSYYEYDDEYSGSIIIPATVTYEGVNYSVTSIGECAFMYCYSLTSITLPESVTSIGEGAFSRCTSLTSITLPESVTSIGDGAFEHCESLTSITLPEGLTSIGKQAFCSCSSLTSINIPEGVTMLEKGVFQSCSNLTSVILPEGVTTIEYVAFVYCYSLTSITLPASVTSIGFQAFAFCFSLTSITSHAATPPTIEDSFSFEGVDKSIPVYVPAGSIEAYKAATGWSDFTNYVGIETGIENPEIRNHKSEITYDLNGRRVTDPESRKGGVYIVGGRKVVIK